MKAERRRRGIRLGAVALAAIWSAWAALPAGAQGAGKPIKIIYPFPAGSAGDTVTRIAAQGLQVQTGRTVVVENRAGAGGITGTRSVLQADADGTVLIVMPSAVATMIPIYNPDAGYDIVRDFVPISQLVSQDLALGVGPGMPVKTLEEMITVVRSDPGKGSYGTPGAGSSLHLIGVKLAELAKIKLTPVHYRGAALALNDVIAGQLPMILSPMPDQISQHQGGKLRILATAGAQRSTFVPEVPTFKERGYDIVAQGWFAAFGPAKLQQAEAERISRVFAETVQNPENRERLGKLGFTAVGSAPAALRALVDRDLAYWRPIFKASGFSPTPAPK